MTKEEVLNTACGIISGQRPEDYGKPEDNFRTIADIWTAVLHRRGLIGYGVRIGPVDVALLMVGLKLAREAHRHKDDNAVDACGYMAIAAELAEDNSAD